MKRKSRLLDVALRHQLGRQATLLKVAGHNYASIGVQLGVTAITARDLCLWNKRSLRRQLSDAGLISLPQAVVDLLVRGPHSASVAAMRAGRIRYLAKICSLYTREELLREPGLGRVTLGRIEGWLAAQGYHLREADDPIAEAANRIPHRERRHVFKSSRQPMVAVAFDELVQDVARIPSHGREEENTLNGSSLLAVRDQNGPRLSHYALHC